MCRDSRSADAAGLPSYIASKDDFYEHVETQIAGILEGQRNWVTNLANVSAVLYHAMNAFSAWHDKHVNWAGFYLLSPLFPGGDRADVQGPTLWLGPFCGMPACQSIASVPGKGVCADGSAVLPPTTVCVPRTDDYRTYSLLTQRDTSPATRSRSLRSSCPSSCPARTSRGAPSKRCTAAAPPSSSAHGAGVATATTSSSASSTWTASRRMGLTTPTHARWSALCAASATPVIGTSEHPGCSTRPTLRPKVFSSTFFFFFSGSLACVHARARDQIGSSFAAVAPLSGGDSSLALAAARAQSFCMPPPSALPISTGSLPIESESRQDNTGHFGNTCQNCIQTAVCVWGASIRHVRRSSVRGGTLGIQKKKK